MSNSSNYQDAIARAKEIAQKLSAAAPNVSNSSPLKRPNSDNDNANKRPALGSPTQTGADVSESVLRAQMIAQKINSQFGSKSSGNDSALVALPNQQTFQEEYKIPDKFVGLIIGKNGEQIFRLQAESGCKVQICQTRSEPVAGGSNLPDRLANLSGTKEAIARARRIMDDIVSRAKLSEGAPVGISPYSIGASNIKAIDVMLPSAKCGLIIGKGGENIRRVSEEFGVKMYVAQETSDIDGIEHKPLKIFGDADKVERAKQHVLDSLAKSSNGPMSNRFNSNANSSSSFNEYGSRTSGGPTSGPCNEATYHAQHEKAGIIIGKGGESIKEINRKSGAYVELDKNYIPPIGNSSDRLFKLRGTPEQIVTAQHLMYEKILNSPGGPGDMLTPLQFQQQFNLPAVGQNMLDSWAANNDPYGADASGVNANDPYTQWASMLAQWPQMNPYDNSTAANASSSDMSQMDPAWVAYYQSMSYYSMLQAGMPAADSTTANNNTSTETAASSTSGQVDYSQQWIEYYRSIGQNDMADHIAKQMKETNSTTATSTNSNETAQGATNSSQQWTNGVGSTANTTNGASSSS